MSFYISLVYLLLIHLAGYLLCREILAVIYSAG